MRIIAFVTDSPTVRVILIHLGAPGVDREAAGIPVEPAHRVERRVGVAAHRQEQRSGAVGHRAPRAGLIGNAWHSCGLVDDHQIAVGVHDRALGQRAAPQPGGRSSTTTTEPAATRLAGSRQRSPSTETRPSVHRSRARPRAACPFPNDG
jgi:hypothetical protein